MTVGERIRKARENAGMTLDELAVMCGTIRQTMYKYEHGVVTNIPLDRLQKIADALGVSSAWIAGWAEAETETVGELSETQIKLITAIQHMTDAQAAAVWAVVEQIEARYKDEDSQ